MAFVTDRTLFIHVQKTGGMFVREALYLCRPTGRESGPSEAERHMGLPELMASHPGIVGGRTTFGFVRHPVSWFASRWAYGRLSGFPTQARHRASAASHWMAACWADDYVTFLENMLDRYPGVATQTMFRMLGLWSAQPVDKVGRAENLTEDLAEILRGAGEQFNAQAFLSLPPRNISTEKPDTPRDLRRRIEVAEHLLMDRFYSYA